MTLFGEFLVSQLPAVAVVVVVVAAVEDDGEVVAALAAADVASAAAALDVVVLGDVAVAAVVDLPNPNRTTLLKSSLKLKIQY